MMPQWARKITFEHELDDWVLLQDGLAVGCVMRDQQQSSRSSSPQWAWSVITMLSKNGWTNSIESALEEVHSRAFDRWGHKPHGWPDQC